MTPSLLSKMFKRNAHKGRPYVSFTVIENTSDYAISIKNTGNVAAMIDSIKCDYNTLPFMIKPKLGAKIGLVVQPQQEVTIDMPSTLGTNFIGALFKIDLSYAMPRLVIYYSDDKRNKYKAEYFFVGEEKA